MCVNAEFICFVREHTQAKILELKRFLYKRNTSHYGLNAIWQQAHCSSNAAAKQCLRFQPVNDSSKDSESRYQEETWENVSCRLQRVCLNQAEVKYLYLLWWTWEIRERRNCQSINDWSFRVNFFGKERIILLFLPVVCQVGRVCYVNVKERQKNREKERVNYRHQCCLSHVYQSCLSWTPSPLEHRRAPGCTIIFSWKRLCPIQRTPTTATIARDPCTAVKNIYTVMAKNIGTLGKYDQKTNIKQTNITNILSLF